MAIASSIGTQPASDPIGERGSFDEFEDERGAARLLFDAVNRGDMRMIERGEELGFAVESRQPIGIAARNTGRNLRATSRCSRVSRAR